MNNQPLITGITIFYNADEGYMTEAIASVLAQTYTNWELLLVDDGSTNDSTQLAKNYALHYPNKIRYLEHPRHQNLGMSATRNLGIRQAKGDYIAFLDADDIWLPEKLAQQVAILEAHPEIGAVFNPTLYWHSWTGKSQDSHKDELRQLGIMPHCLWQPPTLLVPLIARKINTPATCSILLRKEVFNKIGYFATEFRHMFEDQVFFAKMYTQISILVQDKPLDLYRQHPDSTSHITLARREYHPVKLNPAYKAYLHWLKNYLHTNQISDKAVWQALNRKLLPYKYPWLGIIYYSLTNLYYQIKDYLRLVWKQKLTLPLPHWLSADKAHTHLSQIFYRNSSQAS